jgi:hypothetical protein
MKLYFTGAKKHNDPQPIPSLSLGGHISSSQIPNGSLDGVFGSISSNTLSEIRGLVFKNESQLTLSGAKLFYRSLVTDPTVSFKMAVVLLTTDPCDNPLMESVANTTSMPSIGTFIDNREIDNAIPLPDVLAGDYLGIWIVRTVNQFKINQGNSCEFLFDQFILPDIQQSFQLTTFADLSGSLEQAYFTFDTPENSFVIWYTTTNSMNIPSLGNREPIRVNLLPDDDAITVATKTQQQITSILQSRGECVCNRVDDVLTIINEKPGLCPIPTVFASGFVLGIITPGQSSQFSESESIELVINY